MPAQEYLSRPGTIRAMTRRFGADGVLHLYEHYGVRSLFEQSLENGARSSKRILKDFSARYPQILPPRLLEQVEGFTADRDTFITLVNEYLLGPRVRRRWGHRRDRGRRIRNAGVGHARHRRVRDRTAADGGALPVQEQA